MSLFVAILLSLVYLHFARFYQDRVSEWILILIAATLTLNLVRTAVTLVYQLGLHPFSVLDLGLSSDQASPGYSFDLEIRAKTKRNVSLTRIEVDLRCTQHKSSERRKQVAVLHQQNLVLAKDISLEPGARKTFLGTLRVSAGSPYSFRSMEGKIRWVIHVLVEVEGWGELRDELEVTVAPG